MRYELSQWNKNAKNSMDKLLFMWYNRNVVKL